MRNFLVTILMASAIAAPAAAQDRGRSDGGFQRVERSAPRTVQPRGDFGGARGRVGIQDGRDARADVVRRNQFLNNAEAVRRSQQQAATPDRGPRPAPQVDVRRDRPAQPNLNSRGDYQRLVNANRENNRQRLRETGRGRSNWAVAGNVRQDAQPGRSTQRQNWSGRGNDNRRDWNRNDTDRRNWHDQRGDRDGRWDRNDRDGRWDRNDRRYDRNDRYDRGWDRNDRNDRRWDRAWRNDRRYDWQRWRYSNRGLFRPGRYYAPYSNYSYFRFGIGGFLQPLFYSNRYWLNDPYQYRLPPAYAGTRWVRYYDDVMLVDVYSGEVIDVIHDFFW